MTRGRAPGAHVAQAMIGDVEAAAETSEVFYRMWLLHGTVPEGFSLHKEARPNCVLVPAAPALNAIGSRAVTLSRH